MTQPNDKPSIDSQLQATAEVALVKSPIGETPATSLEALLHELQVHQVELEMQNAALRQAKSTLENSRNRYLDLYEFAPVGYLILTSMGMIAEINLSAVKLLGSQRNNLLHRDFSAFITAKDQPRWTQLLVDAIRYSQQGRAELALQRSSGMVFHAQLDYVCCCAERHEISRPDSGSETSVTAQLDSNNLPADCLRITLSDISERRQAEASLQKSEEQYRQLAENMPIFIATFLPDGTLTYVNHALLTLVGMSFDELVGQNFYKFLTEDDREMVKVRLALLTPEQPVETHQQLYRTHGRPDACHQWTNRAFFAPTGEIVGFQAIGEDISERKLVEAALQESENRFRSLMENIPSVAVQGYALDGTVTFWNRASELLYGYSAAESLGANLLDLIIPPEMREEVCAAIQHMVETGEPIPASELLLKRKDDSRVAVFSSHALVNPVGRSPELFCLDVDLTERRAAEEALREQKDFFHLIAENIGDFIAVLDLEGRRIYNSPSYRKFFGDPDVLRGTDSFAEIHPEDQERVKRVFAQTVQSGIGQKIEYRFLMPDGSIREIESLGNVIRDSSGCIVRVVVVSHDISERKQQEEEVRRLAFYDELSKLPNRRLLIDRLNQAMAASTRSRCYAALMFLDLDNFKPLNDTHGHEVGDMLLVEAADRLRSCMREIDTVARFGGDEFVVMISELDTDRAESLAQASLIAEKIRVTLSEPCLLTVKREGKGYTTIKHCCTASIGVVLFINHQSSLDDILKWADAAMYQAKEAGRNLVRFFNADV